MRVQWGGWTHCLVRGSIAAVSLAAECTGGLWRAPLRGPGYQRQLLLLSSARLGKDSDELKNGAPLQVELHVHVVNVLNQ